jgi:hypothetical protein
MERDARAGALLPALLERLSQHEREALCQAQLQQAKGSLVDRINTIESSMPVVGVFSQSMSEQLMDALDKALGGKQATGNWHSWQGDQAVLACARRLHPTVLSRFVRLWRQPAQVDELAVPQQHPEAAAPAGLAGLWKKLVSKVADAAEEAAAVAAESALTPEQQARLERARLRPWDDERVLEQLNRIVDLRLALHAALSA